MTEEEWPVSLAELWVDKEHEKHWRHWRRRVWGCES